MGSLMRKLAPAVFAVTAATTLGMVGAPSVAAASACSGPACLFSEVSFHGQWIATNYWEDLRTYPSMDFNDKTSSLWVSSGRVCFYKNANFRNEVYRLSAGQSNDDLRRANANDVISSLRPC